MLFHWSRFGKHLRHRSFKIKVGSIDDNKNKRSWWTHGAFLLEDMGPYWVTWIGPLYGIQNFKRIKRFKPHRRSDLAKLLNPFLYDKLSLNQMSTKLFNTLKTTIIQWILSWIILFVIPLICEKSKHFFLLNKVNIILRILNNYFLKIYVQFHGWAIMRHL